MDRIAPILAKFEHGPRDVRWLGDAIDLAERVMESRKTLKT